MRSKHISIFLISLFLSVCVNACGTEEETTTLSPEPVATNMVTAGEQVTMPMMPLSPVGGEAPVAGETPVVGGEVQMAGEMPVAGEMSIPDEVMGSGACNNTQDLMQLESLEATIADQIQMCVLNSCILERGADCKNCLLNSLNLSDMCTDCFLANVECTFVNCALQCIDSGSDGCTTCRMTNCDAAFNMCSGIEQ